MTTGPDQPPRREGLTQTAISKRAGAPDFRTLSHWETGLKLPSLRLLDNYLAALGLDFTDLQEALNCVRGGRIAAGLSARLTELEKRVAKLEELPGHFAELEKRTARLEKLQEWVDES